MRTVQVDTRSTQDGDDVANEYIVETRDAAGNWSENERILVKAGTPEAKRRFLLDDNQRLIVADATRDEIVFDKEQNAAVRVPRSVNRRAVPDETRHSTVDDSVERAQQGNEAQLRRDRERKLVAEQQRIDPPRPTFNPASQHSPSSQPGASEKAEVKAPATQQGASHSGDVKKP